MNEDEERTPRAIAHDLMQWAGPGKTGSREEERAISNALYTLSEGHAFEEYSIGLESALVIHSVIEKIKQNGGMLPKEYGL